MELFLLYIWLKLGAISTMLIVASAILTVLSIILMLWIALYNDNNEPELKYSESQWKRLVIPAIFCALFAGLLPTKTDVAVLVAGHYALKLSDTPEAGKLMTVIRKKANDILDAELAEKK